MPTVSTWTQDGLIKAGFEGFVPFALVDQAPAGPGVYVVVRGGTDLPTYLERSPAGHFQGHDPTVDLGRLQDAWVADAVVVYIG